MWARSAPRAATRPRVSRRTTCATRAIRARCASSRRRPACTATSCARVGDHFLYVNSERLTGDRGRNAAPGLFIFDISKPDQPKEVGFYDTPGSGPHRFGVDNERQLAFLPNDAEGWNKRVIWTLDIRIRCVPRWSASGACRGRRRKGTGSGNDPMPADDTITLHGPPMIRGNRMYCAFWGGGIAIIDCTDLANMQLVGHLQWSPPFPGSNHTAWPVGDRPYLIVTDEARARQKFWDSQFMWVIDIRKETNPIPVATFFPDREKYFDRPGRFGAHNILENIRSEGPWANIVFLTYFNAGLRAVDVTDPLRPKEVGCYVPALPDGQEAIQSNDIGSDEHGRLYLIDRAGAGMHILEYTG